MGHLDRGCSGNMASEAVPAGSARNGRKCWDVIVVGGGPAGLSAALILARARRSVLIFDSGQTRNEASLFQHAVLGAEGFRRREFLEHARQQVLNYPEVRFEPLTVEDIDIKAAQVEHCKAHPAEENCNNVLKGGVAVTETSKFVVFTEDRRSWRSKKLILATGVRDHLPEVEGFREYWAKGIWVCLYCDGYEYRDQTVACMGNAARGVHLVFEMLQCVSKDCVLLTHGQPLSATRLERQLLCRHGVKVYEQRLARAYGDEDGQLAGVELEGGERVPCRGLFFNTGRCQHSSLPSKMGLKSDDRGDLVTDVRGNVQSVHGLYVAGNMAQAPLKLVITAAAQGAATGATINSELFMEELGLDEDAGERYVEPFCAEGAALDGDAARNITANIELADRADSDAGTVTISTKT